MSMPLVMVPGHGVCITPGEAVREASWEGIHAGEASLLVEHIRAGVREAAARGAALIFSGGQTCLAAGGVSEGQSYRNVAAAADWWGSAQVAERCLVEGFARDSLENLSFAVARYRQAHACDASALIICGWGFKAARYELHKQALGWQAPFTYVAVNDPAPGAALEAAQFGERAKLGALGADPLLAGPEWQRQRASRDPFEQGNPYA